MLIPPRKHTLAIPATDLAGAHQITYYEWGHQGGIPVICVHGLTRNAHDFDFLASALADDFCIIAPDMPGRGDSDWLKDPSQYNYATYIADILFLLNERSLDKVHWVGTSMGGIIGMMLAQSIPTRLLSIMLNDIGAMIPAGGLKRILSYAGVAMEFASRSEAEKTLRTNCAPYGITQEEHWQHLFTHSIQEHAEKFRLAYDPNITAGLRRTEEIQDINLWPFFDAMLGIPTLLIRGQTSDILPREVALQMKAKHPNLTLCEIQNAGHAPALMAQDQIDIIQHWLMK